MVNKKRLVSGISFAVIFIAAICLAVFYFRNQSLRNLSITEELSARFRAIDKNSLIQKNDYKMWWDDNEGYSLLASTTESVLVVKNTSGIDQIYDQSLVPAEIFKNESNIVREVFTRRGFILNKRNSAASTTDDSLWDYVQAYEKGDYLCTVTINSEASTYPGGGFGEKAKTGYQLYVSCTDKLADAEAEQIPFLDALGLKDKGQFAIPGISEGDYFRVETGGRRGGQYAILKKEDGKYRILAMTQEPLHCSLIKKEKIPESIANSLGDPDNPGCFADNGATYIQGIYEPFSYSTIGVLVSVSQEEKIFDLTADQLKSAAAECGTINKSGYFDKLVARFNGARKITYIFKYQGASQDDGIYKITVIENKAGYTTLDQFKKDFDFCAVAGDAYPKMLNDKWLLFVSACGSGYDDDSGRPHGCDEVRNIIEPSLKLN